ncbi:Abi family protein [Bizionia gelidisalsuginis]|uniref:Abi family protein n=1 Tax=Bizionia gelidisalsuginis TaxID=291188 RepID=A0ABY3MDW3_9FLAO|nr:Abi family protein [Bizionia gelidisalsuginis]TYC17175.1 Abi family protein [Bizionia gelidisalsuginis]
MGKFAIPIPEQIKKFESRGLSLDCYSEDKLKEILLDIGYYRLGYYCHPFIDKKTDKFKENIKISDIVTLYYLDSDLKHLLLKYINRIEVNFRTKVIYYTSMKYKEDPKWFVNRNVMNTRFIKDFDKIYNVKFKTDNLTIKKHHKKHPNDDFAPVWKTFEYLTLGAVITAYANIKNEDIRIRISNCYQIRDLDKFMRLIHTVRQMRNICAHGAVLFDFHLPQSINSIPQITFNKGDRNSVDACIKVISFFTKCISTNRHADIEEEVGCANLADSTS